MVNNELNTDVYICKRDQKNVFARAVYYKLAREFTPYSYQRIAEEVHKNHATALHGVKMYDNFKIQPKYYEEELRAFETISKVLDRVEVKKKESPLQRLIIERDHAVEEFEKLKKKHNHMLKFYTRFDSKALERHGV
jgi:hypothetical protein